jgi:betaine-aldehyde dehydrogenase
MGIWKVIPALAAGCAIVLKPSELAPLSCLLFGELLAEAGLPKGAINIVSGLGPSAGGPLSLHDGVDKVSFTGSVPTAQKIMAAAALGPRAISLELGGKSPLIVFDDAENVEAIVDWILTGILWGSGQVCSATSRVLLQKNIKQQVYDRLLERLPLIKIGNSLSEEMQNHQGPTMGPVVSKGQFEKIVQIASDAEADGIALLYGGVQAQQALSAQHGEGYFVHPCIFVDVPVTARIWTEEIFGPVLCIREFETEEEVMITTAHGMNIL